VSVQTVMLLIVLSVAGGAAAARLDCGGRSGCGRAW
jgi:hypothetical protein